MLFNHCAKSIGSNVVPQLASPVFWHHMHGARNAFEGNGGTGWKNCPAFACNATWFSLRSCRTLRFV
jgi:hypothetical protein